MEVCNLDKTYSLTDKWLNRTLTQEDVFDWVVKQRGHERLYTSIESDHVAKCMHHIYLWHMRVDGREGLGHFLTAVIRNDFMEACFRADDTNSKVLPLYASFLYNIAPMDYKVQRKALEVKS